MRLKIRRVRPDANGEREHGDGGEAGVFQQLAEGEFEDRSLFVVGGQLLVVSVLFIRHSALRTRSTPPSSIRIGAPLSRSTFVAWRAGSQQAKRAAAMSSSVPAS